MKKKTLINLKNSLDQKISPNKQKILGALSVIPFIAASSMQGACAVSCPYGMVNDPYPGNCSRYTDLNGDGICDLSQAVTTATTDQTTTSTSDPDTSTQTTDSTSGHGSHSVNTDSSSVDQSNMTVVPDSSNFDNGSTQIDQNNYHVLPITLLIIGGYLFTYYLFKIGILKPQKHKRIWNLLLLGGYLGTGLTGVLLTSMINLGISTIYNPSITYWHAELSILMVVGTLVHIHIYKKPFKNMFKVLFGFKFSSKKNTKRKLVST